MIIVTWLDVVAICIAASNMAEAVPFGSYDVFYGSHPHKTSQSILCNLFGVFFLDAVASLIAVRYVVKNVFYSGSVGGP